MTDEQPINVATINFHFAQNYGAVLQALALQDRLESLGAEVTIINYRPLGHWQQYAPLANPIVSAIWKFRGSRAAGNSIPLAFKHGLARFVNAFRSWKDWPIRRQRYLRFEDYIGRHLHESNMYRSLRSLRKNPPVADIYTTGSDQVWNPTNTGGLDPAYYLNFGPTDVVRAGYAVSPCQLNVAQHATELHTLCSGFDSLTLREAELLSSLEDATGRNIGVVPDPVLLMTPELLEQYRSPVAPARQDYLLLYAVRTPSTLPLITRLVEAAMVEFELEVIDISSDPSPWPFPVTRPTDLDPGSFISYIADARYVISNSFHATVLSLLFEREFSVTTAHGTAARMQELLARVGLSERILNDDSDLDHLTSTIDYHNVSHHISELRRVGMTYLSNVVNTGKSRRAN